MRRLALPASALFTVALLLVACTDRRSAPTAPELAVTRKFATQPGTCTTYAALESLVNQVFGAGSPNANAALGKLDNLDKKLRQGDIAGAQAQANNLIGFIQNKAATLVGRQYVNALIAAIQCYAGLTTSSALIFPADTAQIIRTASGAAGISFPANPVSEPTLVTLTMLSPTGPAPLITTLDQYPGYLEVTQQSSVPNSLIKPVVVAVCPSAGIPDSIRSRLRLGHQATAGFELTPQADGSFLNCAAVTTLASANSSLSSRLLHRLASLVTPRNAWAARSLDLTFGGVGGTATEFSPFAPVDAELSLTGGVGGTATEFIKTAPADTMSMESAQLRGKRSVGAAITPANARLMSQVTNVIDCSSATVGSAVRAECRPQITLMTARGTIMRNVPVRFAVAGGGGQTAVDSATSRACGAFGQAASTSTNANGKAGACWTVGATEGTNTLSATPSAGGDAPAGVTFSPASFTFTVQGVKITPTVSATGGNFVYDGAVHAGTASCSNGLTPTVTYSGGGAPTAVGSYTMTATCGTGSAIYNEVSAIATVTIAAAVPVVTLTCPASVTYDGSAQTPCTSHAVAPGLDASPAIFYSNNTNAGEATAAVAMEASGNYAAASASATFQIAQATSTTTVSCPATAQVYSGAALTPCSATTTGAGGLNTNAASLTYSDNVNVGTATVTAAWGGDANHTASSGAGSFAISAAATTTVVSCPATGQAYTGAAIAPCTAQVTGAGSFVQSLSVVYGNNVNAGTASASASFGGDANHLASTDSRTFTIVPAATSVAVSCPASVTYSGAAQTVCSATVSGPALSASLPVSYTNNVSAGAAGASASYAGGANWNASAGTATFAIAKRGATATAGSATINFGAAVPTLPCAVSGLLAGESGAVTCAASVAPVTAAGSYTVTPVWSPSNPLNYAMTGVNGVLNVIGYTQVNCFSTPIYNVMPDSKSAQRKGSNLPVKCGLTNAQGVSVTNATGNLIVQDRGTDPLVAPTIAGTTVFSGTNVFKVATGGNYAYGLDTSPAGFVAGHYYYVTATWSDGSRTTGWFLLK